MIPDKNSLVVFDKNSCDKHTYQKYYLATFEGKVFLFLGEIKQMPGHCVLVDIKTKEILTGFHTENFREATEDEV